MRITRRWFTSSSPRRALAGALWALPLVGMLALPGFGTRASPPAAPAARTYYVSSSGGSDANDGLSQAAPLASVSAVNGLPLAPGDQVLFKCGDTWRADPLLITKSGSPGSPITFGSYPAGCTNRPVLSGAQTVAGWTAYNGAIYVADLAAGANTGKFPNGLNQLFRGGERLTLGRWPNLDAGDGGYSTLESQPASNRFSDDQLPAGDWTGAIAHIRGMRWYILNRQVTARNGNSLTVGANLDCWGGSCAGWGYFLNNHLNAVDREGEWYYDAAAHRVYLYSAGGAPADGAVEGSVILQADDRSWGGILLGEDLGDPIAYVTVANLEVSAWFRHGIATPTNYHAYESHDLLLQDNRIVDVDADGIHLAAWVYDAQDGRPDGWRGGYSLELRGNTITGANHRGIDSYARESLIAGNVIRDVGLIENLGSSGMGCDLEAGEGACTEDGDGIRLKIDQPADTSHHVTVSGNLLGRIAYNGLDVFGGDSTIARNVIRQPCYAKGDCGGVRTFGRDSLSSSAVHDLTFQENLVLDSTGNTDGCHSDYRALFGFGLYIDNYSRDVTITANTVISATAAGILYQNSTGSATDNVLYNNSRGSMYSAQVALTGSPTHVSNLSGNVLYGLQVNARTLSTAAGVLAASDHNSFFNPYLAQHIAADGARTLAEWQSYSGLDAHSTEAWFQLEPGDPPNSAVFYNDTPESKTVDLGLVSYLDLDQGPVSGSLVLPPYRAQVLVESGELADLALAISISGGSNPVPGEPLTYTLTLANQGSIPAVQVTLTHLLPNAIVNPGWQASDPAVTARSGAAYIWDLPDLAPGAQVQIVVSGVFAPWLQEGAPVALFAEAATASPEPSTGNNQASLLLGDWLRLHLPVVGQWPP